MKYLKHLITACCITLLLIIYSGANVNAHWADSAVGEMTIAQNSVELSLTLPTELLDAADENNDQQISQNEIQRNQVQLMARLNEQIQLTNQRGEVGALEQVKANRVERSAASQTHSSIVMNYRWETSIESLKAVYKFFPPKAPNARCVITVLHRGKTQSVIFSPMQPTQDLIQRSTWQQARDFFWLGIEHILTGYDHVLFIIGLLLIGGISRTTIKLLVAFTVAHSATLAMATFNILVLPSQFVESMIALSIVYVALGAIIRKRWLAHPLVIFALGLIHGLGFAGILQDMSISGSSLGVALLSFNTGLEIGQILIAGSCAVMIYAISKIRLAKIQYLTLTRMLAGGLALMGGVWFVERVYFL